MQLTSSTAGAGCKITFHSKIKTAMNKIYCSNCGKLIDQKSNFCRYCGAAQHGPAAAVFRAQAPTLKHSLGAYALAQTNKQDEPSKPLAGKHEYIKRQHLPARAQLAFFVSYVGATAIVPFLLILGFLLDPVPFSAAFIGYLIALYILAALIYNSFYYSVDSTGFIKDYGVIHKRQVTIPFQQIQNVNITRSLVDRLLGLAKLSIETAGAAAINPRDVAGGSKSSAEGHLPGLTLVQAKKIHDLLLAKANDTKSD